MRAEALPRLPWSDAPGGWLATATRIPSPNQDPRPVGVSPDLLVVHHISLPPGRFSGPAITQLFTNALDANAHPAFEALRGLRVSAHFLIRRRGELVQYVGCDARAWHAGQSAFQGRPRCNDFSIGVELEGSGERPFTGAQYRRLAQLARALCERYPLRWAAGHSDVAPGRKTDPGPFFEWPRFLSDVASTRLERPFPAATRAET